MTCSNHSTRRQFLRRTLASGMAATVAPLAGRVASAADELPQRPRWQIGCWSRPWAKFDYRVAMDNTAEAGYKFIALTGAKTRTGRVIATDTTLEESQEVGEQARQRGLQITFVYGGGLPLDKGPESLRKMIDNCAAARGQSVVIAHLGDEKTVEQYCKSIADCCDYAASRSVSILLKPHGGMMASGLLCRQALQRIGHPNCSLMYDPGNIYFYSDGELDPVADADTTDGLVTAMSVKDYQHPKNVALTPGTGQVDFPALMARLYKGGFTGGPLAVEMVAPGDLAFTLHEAKQARLFVEQLVASVSAG